MMSTWSLFWVKFWMLAGWSTRAQWIIHKQIPQPRNPGSIFRQWLILWGGAVTVQALVILALICIGSLIMAHQGWCIHFFGTIISTRMTLPACYGVYSDPSMPNMWLYHL